MTISYKENKVINGLNYSPFNTNNNCKTQSDMETDLILINKMTNKIRLYSNDCNQIEMVLQIIAQKRLSMKVLLGIWIRGGQQKIEQGSSAIINVLTKNPSYANYVLGVTVGNEELFNGMNVNQLVNNIIYVRQQFQKNKINNVIISTVEVGDKWCDQLVKVCDTVFANLYSYFGPNPTPSNDITQVMTQAVQSVLDQATNLINKYQRNVTISETGWPSNGSPDKNQATFAPASIQNQALFLKGFICKAKKMNLDYYLLEALDSTWKSGPSIEKNFGIMDQNHNFKGFNPLLLSC
ncbi:glycoside hydrolase [Neoconidiobolus thromboides FSU 785]|nr:glycoside hydrolase [Neoconidiobolus thromboides FSU 785]